MKSKIIPFKITVFAFNKKTNLKYIILGTNAHTIDVLTFVLNIII